MAPMLSNHDSFAGQRPADQFSGNLAQLKLAASAYLLLPGTSFIYYGEEIGLRGAPSIADDGRLRTPMSWSSAPNAGFTTGTPYRALAGNAATANVAAQQADPDGLLQHYRTLLALRNGLPALRDGSYLNASAQDTLLSFQRQTASQTVVVVLNFGTASADAVVRGLPTGATLQANYPTPGPDVTAAADGSARVTLPPQSLRVFTLR
jgi:glycosidase